MRSRRRERSRKEGGQGRSGAGGGASAAIGRARDGHRVGRRARRCGDRLGVAHLLGRHPIDGSGRELVQKLLGRIEPRVSANLREGGTAKKVDGEDGRDQRSKLCARFRRWGILDGLDLVKDLGGALAVKGEEAAHQGVYEDTKGPDVGVHRAASLGRLIAEAAKAFAELALEVVVRKAPVSEGESNDERK